MPRSPPDSRPKLKGRAQRRDEAKACHWCAHPVRQGTGPHPWPLDAATVEHLVPRSRGGSSYRTNLATACRSCNEGRSDISTHAWKAWLDGEGAEWRATPPAERGRVPSHLRAAAKRASKSRRAA